MGVDLSLIVSFGGHQDLVVFEADDREQVILDEVSDHSPHVASLVTQLLDSVDIQLDLVEPICYVSFDQELLEESIDLDTATSDLESIHLIPLDLEVLHAESEDLHLVREVVEAHHEVKGLDDAVIGEGVRGVHWVHFHHIVAIQC